MPHDVSEGSLEPSAATKRGFFSLELLDNRYPALHGLRVLAILSVIQLHVTWILSGENHIGIDREFAMSSLTVFFGMDLFFILSGFLIGTILLHALESPRPGTIRRFYLRRMFRTFPSYYVVLTVLAATMPLTATQKSHLAYEYVYLTNFFSLAREHIVMFWGWSLALEEQFYVVVPLLFFLLLKMKSDRARIVSLSLLWLSALVVRLALYLRYVPCDDLVLYGALYFKTYTRFDTLVSGILLALVHRRHGEAISRWLVPPFRRAMLGLFVLTCGWILVRPWMFGPEHTQLVKAISWGTTTSLMYCVALVLLLHGDGWIQRALSYPLFRRIATLGYGVYLVHIPLIDRLAVPIAKRLEARHVPMTAIWPLTFLGVFLLSLALAYVMHVVIEKPSLWVRDKLAA